MISADGRPAISRHNENEVHLDILAFFEKLKGILLRIDRHTMSSVWMVVFRILLSNVMSNEEHTDFLRIYTSHHRDLYRYALMLVVRQADADDVLQEASVALWRKFDDYDPNRPFLPWAKRVVFLEVLNFRKRQRSSPVFLTDTVIDQLAVDDSVHEGVLDVQRDALGRCLKKLSPKDQKLLDARYDDNVKLAEFAESIGRSIASVYVTLSRIRKTLLQCVDRTLRTEGLS